MLAGRPSFGRWASVDAADSPAIAAAQSARRILNTDSMENGYVGAH